MVAGQQSEHSPKGMTYDRNTLSVHARRSLQKRQPGKRVIELTADYQLVVQLPAGLGAPSLSLLEEVLREGALVGRKALATTAEVKKDITVAQKDRGQNGRSFGHRLAGCVLGVIGSGAVIEQHSRKRSG